MCYNNLQGNISHFHTIFKKNEQIFWYNSHRFQDQVSWNICWHNTVSLLRWSNTCENTYKHPHHLCHHPMFIAYHVGKITLRSWKTKIMWIKYLHIISHLKCILSTFLVCTPSQQLQKKIPSLLTLDIQWQKGEKRASVCSIHWIG